MAFDVAAEIDKLKGPIVVFGSGGFIGANLFRTLAKYRIDVYGVTQQSFIPWRLANEEASRILRCDITQPHQVKDLFSKFKFQTIFVLSAYGAYARQSQADLIYKTNVLGLLNIIEAAEATNFAALVHAGSSSEYGLNCQAPAEDAVLEPNSHYAVSKISASFMLRYYAKCKSLPMINLRLYSIYGPFEEADRLIPKIVAAAAHKRYPPLVDAEISRDFVYIDDCVEALLLAATTGVVAAPGQSLNIATGVKTTLRELADLVREVFCIEEPPQFGAMARRAWDVRDWVGNPDLARKVLGWSARVSLRTGLKLTSSWLAEHGQMPQIRNFKKVAEVPRLSAIIACYKDAEAIPYMHRRLTKVFKELAVDYEIIFVNDQSPDATDNVLANICQGDPRVLAIEHSRNFGSQGAFLSGMELAVGDAVILLDGDLQDPPEVIAKFYDEWIKGYEVVYGRRVKRQAPFWQNLAYKAFYRLFRWVAYIPLPVDAGDFSLIDRKVVRELLQLQESDQFLRGLRAWVGFKQIGVDYERPERMFGRSTNNLRKNFWWARKAIFSFSFLPLELLVYVGIGTTILSFLALILQVIARLVHPEIPHGITTIIVLILLFGGLQLLAMSTIGEYVGKILDESKHRPKFIRRALRINGEYITDAASMQKYIKERSGVDANS